MEQRTLFFCAFQREYIIRVFFTWILSRGNHNMLINSKTDMTLLMSVALSCSFEC
jgi:hypothetical protein